MIKQFFQLVIFSLLLGLGLNGATAAAPIDPADEVKITASDGAKDDLLGFSVSLDGTRMAVGAYRAEVGSNIGQGKVYIYDFDGTNWNETAVLMADDGAEFDLFGWSVSLSGDRVAVGSHWAAVGTNIYQGAAYIFDLNGGTWTQTQKLTADDGATFDQFSNALSLDGNRLVVGAQNANNYQGVAYVFELSGNTWSQTDKLTASDGAADSNFGRAVSLDGDRIVVGAPSTDVGGNISQGQVYVYDLNGTNWNETAKLTIAGGWLFGSSVSLDGDRLAVGERFAKVGNNLKQGAAYIFDLSGTTWNESAKLTASDGGEDDYFGMAIALEGDRVAVGAYDADANGDFNRGEAYVFDLSGGTWNETKFIASDGLQRDEYGSDVALSGDVLAVGAWWADINGKNDQGAVYVYGQPAIIDPADEDGITASDAVADLQLGNAVSLDGTRMAVGARGYNLYQGKVYIYDYDVSTGTWKESAQLMANGGEQFDNFGWSVSLEGDRVVVGAYQADSYKGAAYVFELSGGVWSQTQKLTADDAAGSDKFGDVVSLHGDRIAVGAEDADINGESNQGAVYIFELDNGAWVQSTKLTASNGVGYDEFGSAISLDNDRLAVSAPWHEESGEYGLVYVFDFNGSDWDETAKVRSVNASIFGSSVSLDGDRLAVGDKDATIGGNSNQGTAFIFELNGGTWSESAKLIASDGRADDYFGMAIDLDGDRVAIGADSADVNGDYNRGEVYVFDLISGNWHESKFIASDGAERDGYGVDVAVSGDVLAVGAHFVDKDDNNRDFGKVYVYGQPIYSIGGIVRGLTGTLVLQNNAGDDLTLTADGVFKFTTPIADGGVYAVSVLTQPAGQNCVVTNDNGTVNGSDITDVQVSCITVTYNIGGTVSGLTGTVVLQNNAGDDLTVTANGVFTFATPIADGGNYAVSVLTQPAGQTCVVTNESGTVSGSDVTNVQVTCSDIPPTTYDIGGMVSGLTGTLVLQNNAGDDLTVTANGNFTFATPIADGSDYGVSILTLPAGQTCQVTNGSGTVSGAAVTDVQVTCYKVGRIFGDSFE